RILDALGPHAQSQSLCLGLGLDDATMGRGLRLLRLALGLLLLSLETLSLGHGRLAALFLDLLFPFFPLTLEALLNDAIQLLLRDRLVVALRRVLPGGVLPASRHIAAGLHPGVGRHRFLHLFAHRQSLQTVLRPSALSVS